MQQTPEEERGHASSRLAERPAYCERRDAAHRRAGVGQRAGDAADDVCLSRPRVRVAAGVEHTAERRGREAELARAVLLAATQRASRERAHGQHRDERLVALHAALPRRHHFIDALRLELLGARNGSARDRLDRVVAARLGAALAPEEACHHRFAQHVRQQGSGWRQR